MLILYCCFYLFFFFKQKTAYEMRISDWSSDVCSSDPRVVAAHRRDIDVALLEDTVVGDEADRILEQSRQPRVEPVADVGEQLERRVLMHPADAEIVAVHPRARHALEEVHAVFAHFEQTQVRRHRADIHHMAAEVEHMVRYARQLGDEHRSAEHTTELQYI